MVCLWSAYKISSCYGLNWCWNSTCQEKIPPAPSPDVSCHSCNCVPMRSGVWRLDVSQFCILVFCWTCLCGHKMEVCHIIGQVFSIQYVYCPSVDQNRWKTPVPVGPKDQMWQSSIIIMYYSAEKLPGLQVLFSRCKRTYSFGTDPNRCHIIMISIGFSVKIWEFHYKNDHLH